ISNSARTAPRKWSFGESFRFCQWTSQVPRLARVLKPCCKRTKRVVRISLPTTRIGENALPPGTGTCSIGFVRPWERWRGALRYDASVDVRLAALDALSRHGRQPQVHKAILDSLQQQSPLVQVALIDLLLEWRDPDAAQRLQALQQAPNLNPTVRQRVEWAKS